VGSGRMASPAHSRISLPTIRPFRGLRYEPEAVGDLARVVSPPYDVISPADQRALLERHPRNAVRLDFPAAEPGDGPDDQYRRAARAFAEWRSDGTFHKDPRPSLYAYEQTYRVPGTAVERTQRGFFGRLRLEPFSEGSGVLPHERTMTGPKEDRYKLLRATGANTSPAVGLFRDQSGRASEILARVAKRTPEVDIADSEGVRHRLWVVPEGREGSPDDGPIDDLVAELVRLASAAPITIADGHHRYETALRYREERRMSRSCEEDPAFDYILMLFLEATHEPITILPTHRVVRRLEAEAGARLVEEAVELFDVRPAPRGELLAAFGGEGLGPGGRGRFGLWTRDGGAFLEARREAFVRLLPPGGQALRHLDVTLLGVALERLAGVDASDLAAGERVAYTKSASEALDWVDRGVDGADAAFLLEPTPVRDVLAVAAEGDVMPQKSTYFYPKALTGLVINPLEW
jgi:uncharacterized protein (DUF1015 family)